MYLSRLLLNPRRRPVRVDLHDCNQLKRTVMRGFPQAENANAGARDQFGVLYRLDHEPRSGIPSLIVQSTIRPDWLQLNDHDPHYLLEDPDCKDVSALYDRLMPGQELRFRLRANPTKRLIAKTDGNGHKLAGKRVELRREEDRLEWLERKAEESGFVLSDVRTIPDLSAAPEVYGLPGRDDRRVPDVRETPVPKVTGESSSKHRLTFATVVFDGYLRISEINRFRAALEHGIGPAKAYGFGLLSIAPVR